MTLRCSFLTSSYLSSSLRVSALRPSTVCWARSIALVTMRASIGTSSGRARPMTQLTCLDRHVIGQGSSHDPADGTGREQPHQLVLERQVEPALAAIALAPGPGPELVDVGPALVALAPEDVEATDGSNLVRFGGAL